MKCAECKDSKCGSGRNCSPLRPEMVDAYRKSEEALKILKVAATIEAEFFMQKTRVEETVEFIKRMGYKKVGLAFCLGLKSEAAVFNSVLKNADIQVSSVCCKLCGMEKEELELQKRNPETKEITCNPMGQAETLNRDKTELNISFGLCVGHDVLFNQASKAPVTTLLVKDKVLGHNPAAALYSGFYKSRLNGGK